jgi:hypothetical protein
METFWWAGLFLFTLLFWITAVAEPTLLFDQLFGKVENLASLPTTDTSPSIARQVQDARKSEGAFTGGVDLLRSRDKFPNPHINALCGLLWNLVENKVVTVMLDPVITALHFYGEASRIGRKAAIMIPPGWTKMIEQDALMQAGAIVFNASLSRDYYNGRLEGVKLDRDATDPAVLRGIAFEAEYLLTAQKIFGPPRSGWEPSAYHKHVLGHCPKGLASLPPELYYDSKPFRI